jgi:hypothetical protein
MKDKVFMTGIFIVMAALLSGLAGCPLEAADNVDAKVIKITETRTEKTTVGIKSVWVFSDLDFSMLGALISENESENSTIMPDNAIAVGPTDSAAYGTEISLALFLDKTRLKAWKGSGSYYVAVMENYTPTVYVYTNGGELTADKKAFKKLEFNKRTTVVPWSGFKKVEQNLLP